jgi:hypothetical protein
VPETAKKPSRTGEPLHVYLPPELRAALKRVTVKTRRKLTTEVTIALERHCAEHGEWPPPAP